MGIEEFTTTRPQDGEAPDPDHSEIEPDPDHSEIDLSSLNELDELARYKVDELARHKVFKYNEDKNRYEYTMSNLPLYVLDHVVPEHESDYGCLMCGSNGSFQYHHVSYFDPEITIALCSSCHGRIESKEHLEELNGGPCPVLNLREEGYKAFMEVYEHYNEQDFIGNPSKAEVAEHMLVLANEHILDG